MLLKRLIIFALSQYFFLFALTYAFYNWDVAEPISYLLATSMETYAIYYFLRRGFTYSQKNVFKKKFDAVFNARLNQHTNSTNFLKEIEFAKNKRDMLKAKMLYGITSN